MAYPVRGKSLFVGYRVLGDDVVIFDDFVATKYRDLMQTLGVEISNDKTHISKKAFEIAKRWFYKGDEISPFPLNSLLEDRFNPYMIGANLYQAIEKGWLTKSNQSFPGSMSLAKLTSALGFNSKSRGRAEPKIVDSFL